MAWSNEARTSALMARKRKARGKRSKRRSLINEAIRLLRQAAKI
jgi:hypothetical protein